MYKIMLILILSIVFSSCTGVVKIRERYHIAPFEKKIEKGNHKIILYQLKYPEKYEEKLKFYSDFNILVKKLIISNSALNIMYSEELKQDLLRLEKNYMLSEEYVYSKIASELSLDDKSKIDKEIDINIDKSVGEAQYYINKQVYFWYEILNSKDIGETNRNRKEYDFKRNYTELDKEELIRNVKGNRKELFELIKEVRLNSVFKVENPYKDRKKSYWDQKEVEILRDVNIIPDVLKENEYIYLQGVREEDVKKILSERIEFASRIVIVENSLYEGHVLRNSNFIFLVGGKYKINYYDGYEVNVEVENVELVELLGRNEKLLLEDFIYLQ